MDCADEDTLAAMIGGALSEQERAAIAIHAASCSSCHALIAGLVTTDATPGRLGQVKFVAGDRVGRYEIDARIGAGGMGVVYSAIDTELQRKVALKLLRPEGTGIDRMGTQGRERLMREARLLAALSHPNVVTVFDVGTHEGHVFVAMELVEGGNLSTWLSRAPRTTNEIVDRMIEAGRGLAAAHARGVIHRDVKPDNILVGLDDRARMTDFGLARIGQDVDEGAVPSAILSPDLTATGALMGTPVYMAPEQWKSGRAEARTDQWSFCATLYEVVAGVRPFSIDDPAKRLAEIEGGRLAPPRPDRRVPAWLRKVVVRGLRASLSDRWDSMDIVVDALVHGRRRRRRIVQTSAIVGAIAIVGTSMGIAIAKKGTTVRPVQEPIGMASTDMRPGCNCPFSTCEEGKCDSVCTASDFDFIHRRAIPGLEMPGTQEAAIGLSTDGNAILYLSGKRCDLDRLMIAYKRGDTYVPTDLTDQLDLARLELVEGCCTFAPDGKSVIVRWRDHYGYDRIALSGTKLGSVDRDVFANLRPDLGPKITVGFPAISLDELRMYTVIFDSTEGPDQLGTFGGAYVAARTDRAQPFVPGQRMSGPIRTFAHVTAESSDGLSAFNDTDYGTAILSRSSVADRFDNHLPNATTPRIIGVRTYPVGDCSRVITTYTPGGCRQEDIVWLDAVHRPPYEPATATKK